MHSIKRREANLPKTDSKPRTSPIWLNSFLSLVVPSCFMDISDPAIINESNDKDFKRDVFRFNRKFQQKVIGRQIITSTLIILGTVGIICYLINNPYKTESDYKRNFNYNRNIFYNNDFNIYCSVLGGMGFISFLFSRNIDVFEAFGLNETGKVKKTKIRYSSSEAPDQSDGAKVEVVTPIDESPDDISIKEKDSYLKERGLVKLFVCILVTLLVLR